MTARNQILELKHRIADPVVGQAEVIDHLLTAILAIGHVRPDR
jgi:hypothetical protein